MGAIDISQLTAPISDEQPAGKYADEDMGDLSGLFSELSAAVVRKPESEQFGQVVPAVEPNWGNVRQKCLDVFAHTRDLRVAAHLAHALLHTNGFSGLKEGFDLLREMIAGDLWKSVYPPLDEDFGDDPFMRTSVLEELSDRNGMCRSVQLVPLVPDARVLDRVSARGAQIALGQIESRKGDPVPPDISTVETAFSECDPERMSQAYSDVVECLGAYEALKAAYKEKSGVDLEGASEGAKLSEAISIVKGVLAPHVPEGESAEAPDETAESSAAEEASAPAAPAAPANPTAIESREDVIKAFDRVCDYYRKKEPLHPVPILLRRAKRWVQMDNFMQILEELAPDGVANAQNIFGVNIGEE
ncbi:MAG: type VI secretion system protein TssA [Planctomycetota bacterium]